MTMSYQLYCSRNFPPLADTLRMLARLGYTSVEGYGGLYADVEGLAKALNSAGLAMNSGHMGLDQMESDPAGAVAIAQRLGMKAVFAPYVMPDDRPTDAAGWREFGARVSRAGAPFRAAGITFGWHNHDFELKPLPTGEVPLDLIAAAEDMKLELDLGWVRRAGEDPAAWIARYPGQIAAVHLKDIAPQGQNADEDGWADVGHGIMDWPPINRALDGAGVKLCVIEHDNPSDHERFARRSLETVQAF